MYIINDYETLMRLVPNVITAVEGEQTLFDKVREQLENTEQWAADTFTGRDIMANIADDDTETPPRRYLAALIAAEAMRRAIPALDLVLTPNGFGVVSNANVAPASKERVDRLINAMADARDTAIGRLLRWLGRQDGWLDTEQGQWLTSSFVIDYMTDTRRASSALRNTDLWRAFVELRHKARPVENLIEQKWLGHPLALRLKAALAGKPGESPATFAIADTVRSVVIDSVVNGKTDFRPLDTCIDFIIKKPAAYPEWHSHPVAELFEDKWRFKNVKSAPGYFF